MKFFYTTFKAKRKEVVEVIKWRKRFDRNIKHYKVIKIGFGRFLVITSKKVIRGTPKALRKLKRKRKKRK